MAFIMGQKVYGIKSQRVGTVVESLPSGYTRVVNDDGSTTSCEGHPEKYYKLITPCDKKNNVVGKTMSLISKLMLSLKSEPEKSFIKAGITNADGTFTCEGKELFINWLFQDEATRTKFNTEVAQPILEQIKEDKDCAK